ncbi:hypothetical protein [Chitinophaga sp. ARDCPP14]|uniref:hypothetical protein n=1 Tax=Chitinophaga sp. ARDCPP14 TaxID=3391139 RepID=UPI003F522B4D
MLYKIALFLHIIGALMVCAAIAIEWLCIIHFRKTASMDRIKESLFYYSRIGIIGDIGALLILVPGIYMMVSVWGDARWAIFGFLGLILIGLIGGIITGRKMKKIRKIMKENNAHSQELEKLINDNSLWFSIKMRTAIFLGVIFLMTIKPELEGSIITISVSIILGALPLRMKYEPSAAG